MHLYRNTAFASAVLAAALFLTAPTAQAHSAHARELDATIQIIQVEARTLVVVSAKSNPPVKMVWNKSTRFIEDGQFVEAAKIREGVQVKLYYRSPFFGKPYLTKIVWNSKTQ